MGAWENREIIDGDMLQYCLNCPYPDCIECSLSKNIESRGRFSEAELELLKNREYTNQELADMLNRTVASIQSKRWYLGVKKYKEEHTSKHNWTKEEDWIILNNKPKDVFELLGKPLKVVYGRKSYLRSKERKNAM